MIKIIPIVLICLLFTSCATTRKITAEQVHLEFIDEHVIPADFKIDNIPVGGLSGIDYYNGYFYIIVDTPKDARYYKTSIPFSDKGIDTIIFNETIFIDKSNPFFSTYTLDPESIRVINNQQDVLITSEGSIKNGKAPSAFMVNKKGKLIDSLQIPNYFSAQGKQKPRHNGVFEGATVAADQQGYWVATELPLTKDGAKPKLWSTKSYVRFTYYDKITKAATKQFAYRLDGISKIPWLYFAVNGVTEIIEYSDNKFLVLERAFSAGHGSHSNTVKLFEVDATNATNTLEIKKLRGADFIPAEKKLLFDFKSIAPQLTDNIIDNIEGMCLGPVLPNGKQTLWLISDNNFNSFGKQLTQVFLFAIVID